MIDLQGRNAEDLDRLVVDWPSQSLRAATLIDTPGTASLSTQTSRRTVRFLNPDDDTPTEADAVVYLMRQLHATDSEFLEAFRDQGVARAASVGATCSPTSALSRVDFPALTLPAIAIRSGSSSRSSWSASHRPVGGAAP